MIFAPQMTKPRKKVSGKSKDASEEKAPPTVLESTNEPPRTIGICGDLDEEKAGEIMYGMIAMTENGIVYTLDEPDKGDKSTISATYQPFEFIISTLGGSAQEMFGIHDLMRVLRDRCEIHTVGLGKVFSAGTLLLASGTKGQRQIGKNCRVMIHSVLGGNHGSIHSLENEMDEIRWTQDRYIEAMVQETNMSKSHLKKILNRKVNAYFTAEEAVELGIADIIF